MDAPFPLWMVFPVIFAALYVSHFSLLRLPYYWDEAGYYIPAAWDFFRTGSLIPITTMSNAHPPLPSVYLALWWKLSGFYPEVTREAVLMVASIGLLAVWRLAQRVAGSGQVAFWTVVLTALYPSLVCAEHTGAGRHLCRSLHSLGTGLCAAGSRSPAACCRFVVHRCGALEGNGHRGSDDAGGDRCGGGISLSAAAEKSPLEGCRMVRSLCVCR